MYDYGNTVKLWHKFKGFLR